MFLPCCCLFLFERNKVARGKQFSYVAHDVLDGGISPAGVEGVVDRKAAHLRCAPSRGLGVRHADVPVSEAKREKDEEKIRKKTREQRQETVRRNKGNASPIWIKPTAGPEKSSCLRVFDSTVVATEK